MALSGSRDFNMTRNDIINSALRKLGNAFPTSTNITDASMALNAMVQSWQSEGIFLWEQNTLTLTLVDGTATYNLATGLIHIEDNAYVREAGGTQDFPVKKITRDDYNAIPTKSTEGLPFQVYYNMLEPTGTATATFNYVPEKAYTFYYTGLYRLQDFDSSTDNPDFPIQWLNALIWGLAYELAPEYGIGINERTELSGRMTYWKSMAKGGTSESDSLCITLYRRRF